MSIRKVLRLKSRLVLDSKGHCSELGLLLSSISRLFLKGLAKIAVENEDIKYVNYKKPLDSSSARSLICTLGKLLVELLVCLFCKKKCGLLAEIEKDRGLCNRTNYI